MSVCVCANTLSWHSTCLNRAIFISSFDQSFGKREKKHFFCVQISICTITFHSLSLPPLLNFQMPGQFLFWKPKSNYYARLVLYESIDRSPFAFRSDLFLILFVSWFVNRCTHSFTRCHSYVPTLWMNEWRKNNNRIFCLYHQFHLTVFVKWLVAFAFVPV